MGTKNNPGPYDCYAKVHPDEPMFILLARDSRAPRLVRKWASMQEKINGGASDKSREAFAVANAMEEYLRQHPHRHK